MTEEYQLDEEEIPEEKPKESEMEAFLIYYSPKEIELLKTLALAKNQTMRETTSSEQFRNIVKYYRDQKKERPIPEAKDFKEMTKEEFLETLKD